MQILTDKDIATEILEQSRREDFPSGDLTNILVLHDKVAERYHGNFIVREEVVLSGLSIVREIYKLYNKSIEFSSKYKDGDFLKKNTVAFEVYGPLGDLLLLERTVLNTLGLMIAVATKTNAYVKKLENTSIKLYDTRKTFPGLRNIEKKAVVHGGAYNHRMSLSDAVLIKENHLKYLDINTLISRLKTIKDVSFVEVEVDSLEFLNRLLELKPMLDIIMLDNFSVDEIDYAVKKINKKYLTEVSGGINLDNLLDYARDGVDRIAIGAITHSVSFPDISFLIS